MKESEQKSESDWSPELLEQSGGWQASISMQYLGSVRLWGRTWREASQKLKALYETLEAAHAYCDQLSSYNKLTHPKVHRRRLELAQAVGRLSSL